MRFTALFGIGAALGLAACGQKGALYLPDKNAAVVTSGAATPAAEPAPAQSPAAQPPTEQPATEQPAPAPPKKSDQDDDQQAPK